MILTRLVELYERRTSPEAEEPLPEPGWVDEEIAFLVDLAEDGSVRGVTDLREATGKGRARAPLRRVPAAPERTSNEVACLLWGKPEYSLGLRAPKYVEQLIKGEKVADEAAARALADQRAARRHALFRGRIEELARKVEDEGLAALLRFLERGAAAEVRRVASPEVVAELEAQAGNVSFRLEGDLDLVCRRPAVRRAIAAACEELAQGTEGQCAITGEVGPIARLHCKIKGVAGARTEGANIVSFNKEAFESFGLSQGANAPISTRAAFAYATALNALLARDSTQKTTVGDTTLVFWAGRATPNEEVLCPFLAAMSTDDPSRASERVRALYEAPRAGVRPCLEDDTPFYILALSAESKSRITIRFFHEGTVREAAGNVLRWFDELAIEPREVSPLSLRELSAGLSVQQDLRNAPPLLAAELLRAAFTGGRFPARVLAEALVRCAAEQGPTRARAALIKAVLIRNHSVEVNVALDPDEMDPAYRLGRLFAVLETLQEEAVRPKATIRDRYWGAASTTPSFVFPQLLSLATSHLNKLEGDSPGLARWYEKQLGEIAAGLPPSLPSTLSLVEQGRFAIGYWHQRFAPKSETTSEVTEQSQQTRETV